MINNTSDHSPIYCDIVHHCTIGDVSPPAIANNKVLNTRKFEEDNWKDFKTELENRLAKQAIPESLKCKNVHCTDSNHIQEIDIYAKQVLEAVDSAILEVASTMQQKVYRRNAIPGWTDIVKPFSDEAKFWHAVWLSAGKPLNTELHRIMKKTRNVYHYAVRKCKKASENIKKSKLFDYCADTGKNIFDELRRMRKVSSSPPSTIDGNDKPASRFADVYGKLYSSINDTEDMVAIRNQVEACINEDSLIDIDKVTTEVVADVVKEIKSNKNDPVFTLNSNCIKNAPSSLYFHLANLIRCFLIHGHVSHFLLLATILPLIKDKLGNEESSENYRSIALSSVLLKIFDWIVLIIFGKSLQLDELQFGYQKDCSTTMCTWLLVESINYFTRNDTDIFTCFMDMKKAFDLVKHSLLFKKLIDRKLPPVYLRLLIYMYSHQTAKVRWNGNLSERFPILNGVKQGAVLSATLFCVYIDDLIKKLRRNRDGSWIDKIFVGMIVYADDVVLLSPSKDGLQNMVDTCVTFAKDSNLIFSTHQNPKISKTKCMAFQKQKKDLAPIKLNDKDLPWVSTTKHLGTTISNDIENKTNQDLLEKRAEYIARNNELNQEFFFAYPCTKIWLNNAYNASFYGSSLWDMFDRDFEKLEKTWNVSQRIMLSLPRTTHRYFIEPLSKTPHITKSLKTRFLNFISKIYKSKKEVLRRVLSSIEHDCRSTTGRNIRKLKLQLDDFDQRRIIEFCNKPYIEVPIGDEWKLNMAKEIINIKSDTLIVNGISQKELDDICAYICSL